MCDDEEGSAQWLSMENTAVSGTQQLVMLPDELKTLANISPEVEALGGALEACLLAEAGVSDKMQEDEEDEEDACEAGVSCEARSLGPTWREMRSPSQDHMKFAHEARKDTTKYGVQIQAVRTAMAHDYTVIFGDKSGVDFLAEITKIEDRNDCVNGPKVTMRHEECMASYKRGGAAGGTEEEKKTLEKVRAFMAKLVAKK